MSTIVRKKIRKNGREISRGGKILVTKVVIPPPPIIKTGYGALYNWFAVEESASKGGFITGYHVPNDEEWTTLENYIQAQIDASVLDDIGIGNILKSCRQVDSPLAGDCNTSVQPRWDAHGTQYGRNSVIFDAFAGGYRWTNGTYYDIGDLGNWWTITEVDSTNSFDRFLRRDLSSVGNFGGNNKKAGLSVRCLRDAELTSAELALDDGTRLAIVQDYNGNYYEVVKIGTQAWLAQNIRCTNYANGDVIPIDPGASEGEFTNEQWGNLTTAAMCWYNNDINTAGIVYTDEFITP